MIAALFLLAAGPAESLDCADAMTQYAMNMCARRDYEAADAEMNAQWKITTAGMKQRDHGLQPDDKRPKHFDTLLAGQRAWLTFRDQHCLLAGFAMRGGSAEPMVHSGCMETLTRARTAQLKSLVETDY